VNLGTLEARDGGTLSLRGTFTSSAVGTVVTDGSPVNVAGGNLDATATPLVLSATRRLGLAGGKVTGSISSADGTPLVVRPATGGSTVTGGLIDAPVHVSAGAGLTASGSSFAQPVSVTAGSLTLTGSWGATAPIVASGSAITFAGTPTAHVSGSVSDSSVHITSSGYTTAHIRNIAFADSRVYLPTSAVLFNSNDVLSLSPATATVTLLGGTLWRGRVTGPQAESVVATTTSGSGTIDGVTLAARATVAPVSTLSVNNGLTLDGGSVSLHAGPSTNPYVGAFTVLAFTGLQSVGGTGTITFDGAAGTCYVKPTNDSGFTIGSGVTVRTGSSVGYVGDYQFPTTSFGTISAGAPDLGIGIFGTRFVNHGTLAAANGGDLSIAANSFTNHGTITADAASVVRLSNGSRPGGTIRLAGTMLVDYYPGVKQPTNVRGLLRTGLAGQTGIIDPGAAADLDRAIGYLDGTLLGASASGDAIFRGHSVSATAIMLTSTRFGDANLDGVVDSDDFALTDKGRATGGTFWWQGDFNYDGTVTSADYLLIDRTYGRQLGGLSPEFLATRQAQFGAAYVSELLASIPEPASLGAVPALGLFCRRRRA
jgi:hypothetical protein